MSELLMLHGWGFSSSVFSPLIDKLETDFAVESPDRAGYGDGTSQGTSGKAATKLSSPTLVLGWSLGGLGAMQLALQQPGRVSGLVLLASTPCFVNRQDWKAGMDETVFAAFRDQVINDEKAAMQQFVRLNCGSRVDRKTRDLLAERSADADREALLAGMEELASTDLRASIEKIKAPVLLLHATDDRVVPVAAGRWLKQHLPNARLVEFSAGGHAFFLQQVEEIADLVRDMA